MVVVSSRVATVATKKSVLRRTYDEGVESDQAAIECITIHNVKGQRKIY